MAEYWHIFVDVWRLMKRFLIRPENTTKYFDRLFEETGRIIARYPEKAAFVSGLCSCVMERLKIIVENEKGET